LDILLLIEPNKVIIYQQEYFHRRKLEVLKQIGNFTTHRLSIEIKKLFRFFVYQRKLEITKNNNDLNDKSKVIKDWDGF
jgi:hypothetical protein